MLQNPVPPSADYLHVEPYASRRLVHSLPGGFVRFVQFARHQSTEEDRPPVLLRSEWWKRGRPADGSENGRAEDGFVDDWVRTAGRTGGESKDVVNGDGRARVRWTDGKTARTGCGRVDGERNRTGFRRGTSVLDCSPAEPSFPTPSPS